MFKKKSLFFLLSFLVPFYHPFGTFWGPKILNFGNFSVPKPRVRKSTPPFYKLHASKCVPDPQNVPKRSPKCSQNGPKISPEASKSLKFDDLEPSSLPCSVQVPSKRQIKHSTLMLITYSCGSS